MKSVHVNTLMYLTSWSQICLLPHFPEEMGKWVSSKTQEDSYFFRKSSWAFLNLKLGRIHEMGLQAQSACSTSCLCENKWVGSNASCQLDKISFSILTAGQRKECVLFIQLLFHADRHLEFQPCDRALCVQTVSSNVNCGVFPEVPAFPRISLKWDVAACPLKPQY